MVSAASNLGNKRGQIYLRRSFRETKGDRSIYVDRLGTKATDQLINTAVGRNQLTGESEEINFKT
jgi:hypothetical protein